MDGLRQDLTTCPNWAQICNRPALASPYAEMTGVCCHAWLLLALFKRSTGGCKLQGREAVGYWRGTQQPKRSQGTSGSVGGTLPAWHHLGVSLLQPQTGSGRGITGSWRAGSLVVTEPPTQVRTPYTYGVLGTVPSWHSIGQNLVTRNSKEMCCGLIVFSKDLHGGWVGVPVWEGQGLQRSGMEGGN